MEFHFVWSLYKTLYACLPGHYLYSKKPMNKDGWILAFFPLENKISHKETAWYDNEEF